MVIGTELCGNMERRNWIHSVAITLADLENVMLASKGVQSEIVAGTETLQHSTPPSDFRKREERSIGKRSRETFRQLSKAHSLQHSKIGVPIWATDCCPRRPFTSC